jgi:hypothetical protein
MWLTNSEPAWSGLTAAQRQALVAVARGEGPYRRTTTQSRGGTVATALENLEGLGVIVRKDEVWVVVDPLFAEWLRNGRD